MDPTFIVTLGDFDTTRRPLEGLGTTPPVHILRVYKLSSGTARPRHFEFQGPDGRPVLLAHIFLYGFFEHDDRIIILFHAALWAFN